VILPRIMLVEFEIGGQFVQGCHPDLLAFQVPQDRDDRAADRRRVQASAWSGRPPEVVDDLGQVTDGVRRVDRRGEVKRFRVRDEVPEPGDGLLHPPVDGLTS
jgi:hypothetical protein